VPIPVETGIADDSWTELVSATFGLEIVWSRLPFPSCAAGRCSE
jgi:hypothetical protein